MADLAAPEWTTTGTASMCAPIRYDGVSVIGVRSDRIVRFRAYFDPGALGRPVASA